MNTFSIICTSLILFSTANSQLIQYVARVRNFSIESETDGAYLTDMKIYQDKNEHKFAATVNITKDIHIKNIEVIVYRCSFEKFDCENFQKWKFTHRLKSIIYMKNQIWTPVFDHITPKLDIPFMKKNIYKTPDAGVNAKAVMAFYPEAVNYFWRGETSLSDHDDKKAIITKLEFSIFTFVERKRKNDRGGTRMSNTRKIPE